MYSKTTATKKIAKLDKRIRAVQGGTSASKTVSILLYLIALAQSDKTPTLTSVVSESLPHLKKGAMRDLLSILKEHGYYKDNLWYRSAPHTYTFETGSQIEFFSADMPSKVRGPRRDRLFMNEANNLPYETFDQLEVRTKDFIFLDWNPTNEFWYYDKVKERDDSEHIILTYKDNEALDSQIVESIEQRKGNKNWWKVYGEGKLGEVEGKIYTGWTQIEGVPEEARLERRGLDFGYSNDPTAIVDVYYWNGAYILDEVYFRKGLSNKQIADILSAQEDTLTVADSAEPKSIDEIRTYGVNIMGCEKGRDSVNSGIQYVQDQKILVTNRSLNILKEYRNYMWMTNKQDGRIINKPDHTFSHTMDAIRYALSSLKRGTPKTTTQAEERAIDDFLHHVPGKTVKAPNDAWKKAIDYDERKAVREFLDKAV